MEHILAQTEEYILSLFKQHDTSRLLYHNFKHTADVVQIAQTIATDAKIEGQALETLLIAAWFHDVGYLYTYHNHEDKSKEIARDFLQAKHFDHARVVEVTDYIEATRLGSSPNSTLAEILADADIAYSVTERFFEIGPMLRLEWEYCLNKVYENVEWEQLQEDFLTQVRFHTPYAQMHFSPVMAQNLIKQKDITRKAKKKLEKAATTNPTPTINPDGSEALGYNNLEPIRPERGVQTYFKSLYRNQVNLSAVADGKANILISVNSIVITLIFAAVFSLEGKSLENLKASEYGIPVLFFVLTALFSLAMAVLSVIPRVTSFNRKLNPETQKAEIRKNLLFFGNFAHLSPEKYEQLMIEILNDSELLYGNMVRDTYYLGVVLNTKYRLLFYAYSTFLGGFILSVLAFLVVWVVNQ